MHRAKPPRHRLPLAAFLALSAILHATENAPLFSAVIRGDRAEVAARLTGGADGNATDSTGKTPLHQAVLHGQYAVAQVLLGRGVEASPADDYGHTPLHYAMEGENQEIASLLLAEGADPNARNARGQTPLHHAVFQGNQAMVALLLAHGADVNAADDEGRRPLQDTASLEAKAVAVLLLAKGADVNATDALGKTPLHEAAIHDNVSLIELLLANGAKIEARDLDGWTPLHRAAEEGRRDAAKALLAHGAEIDARTPGRGETALHQAAYLGEIETVELLMAAGADLHARTTDGLLPLEIAATNESRLPEQRKAVADLLGPPMVQARLNQGAAAAQAGDYLLAIRCFEEARHTAPQTSPTYLNLGLAEAKLPGRELRAIAWLGAYLSAEPSIPESRAATIREAMRALHAKSRADLARMIRLLQTAADEMFHSLGPRQGEELISGSLSARDLKGGNLGEVARLWTEYGDVAAALRIAGAFQRAEYKRGALGRIADAQAGFGDFSGALNTAAVMGEPYLTASIRSSIAIAHVRNGDLAEARKVTALIPDGVAKEWAQYAIDHGRPIVPGRYDVRLPFSRDWVTQGLTESQWLGLLEDDDPSHDCPLRTPPFLDLAKCLESFPPFDDPQQAFALLRDVTDKVSLAHHLIGQMLERQSVQ